jgi:RND family efflux transporter MFP subunit
MKTGPKVLVVTLSVLGVIAGVTYVNRAPQSSAELVNEVTRKRNPVRTLVVRPIAMAQSITRTGVLQANMDVVITAEVGGRVEKIFKELGDGCKEGDVLLRLDQETYRISVAQAKAALEQSEVARDQARRTLDRVEKLRERNIAADAEFDSAEAAYRTSKASTEAARAVLRAASRNLKEATVRCPFTGELAERMVDIGQSVGPSVPLARLVNVDELKLKINVSASQLGQIEVGQQVALSDPDLPSNSVLGSVSRIGVAADPQTRTFPVEIVTENAGDVLRPGQVVEARCEFAVHQNVLAVPIEAVTNMDGAESVLVVVDGAAKRVPVRLGVRSEGQTIVEEGLTPGDEVIIVGGDGLEDGSLVEVIDGDGGLKATRAAE